MVIYISRPGETPRRREIRVWRSLVSRLNGVQEALSSNLSTRTKKKDICFADVFLFGFHRPEGGSILWVKMLGRNEFALRQGFLLRRKHLYGAKAPRPRRAVGGVFLPIGFNLKISILTAPSKTKGNCESSCLLFWVPAAKGGFHPLI